MSILLQEEKVWTREDSEKYQAEIEKSKMKKPGFLRRLVCKFIDNSIFALTYKSRFRDK